MANLLHPNINNYVDLLRGGDGGGIWTTAPTADTQLGLIDEDISCFSVAAL